jgi:hypothetical protein
VRYQGAFPGGARGKCSSNPPGKANVSFLDLVQPGLVSLFDMLIKLDGHEVAYSYGYLANAQGISANDPVDRLMPGAHQVRLLDAVDFVEETCKTLELSFTLAQIPRFREMLSKASTYGEMILPIQELRLRMHDELKSRLFLYVPTIEARYYGVKEAFGEKVASKFGSAVTDIENSGDCIALSLSTASVFHLMRVMERGVQKFGKRLGIVLTGEKNWQNILDEVNKAIKAMPDSPLAAKKKKAAFAAVSANLFNVKLAWRNPVMHPKESYAPEEAAEIYATVKRFMEHLATVL